MGVCMIVTKQDIAENNIVGRYEESRTDAANPTGVTASISSREGIVGSIPTSCRMGISKDTYGRSPP